MTRPIIDKLEVFCSGIDEAGTCTIDITLLTPARTIRIDIPKKNLECLSEKDPDNVLEQKLYNMLRGIGTRNYSPYG